MTMITQVKSQNLSPQGIAEYEDKLSDVTEIIELDLVKTKLKEVEAQYKKNPNELNKVRLGLIYHETALNLTFFYKTKEYAGYAQKSYDILNELFIDKNTTPELLIFIRTYQASSLSLIAGETMKLRLVGKAFDIFKEVVNDYSDISPRPEFMRGSVAENLPWIFWRKKRFAKKDFQSVIEKQEKNKNYADSRVMSFSYWAWANAHKAKKYREKAIIYLNKAIELDPNYESGRKRAEELKSEFLK